MKKAFFLFVFTCTTLVTTAQKFDGIATYKTDMKVDLKLQDAGMSEAMKEQMAAQLRKQFQKEYTLTFIKDESIYEEVESLETPAQRAIGGLNMIIAGGQDIIYRNLTKHMYTTQTELSGKEFLIQDSLQKPTWILEKETKNIGTYTCFKARKSEVVSEKILTNESDTPLEVTKIKTTTAWYTLAIPVQHGPGVHWGLPGLILQLEEGDMTMLCSKIVLNPQTKINIEVPKKGKKVTQTAFDDIQKHKAEEMMERFQRDGRKKGDGDKLHIKIGG